MITARWYVRHRPDCKNFRREVMRKLSQILVFVLLLGIVAVACGDDDRSIGFRFTNTESGVVYTYDFFFNEVGTSFEMYRSTNAGDYANAATSWTGVYSDANNGTTGTVDITQINRVLPTAQAVATNWVFTYTGEDLFEAASPWSINMRDAGTFANTDGLVRL